MYRFVLLLAFCALVGCDSGPSEHELSAPAESYLKAALDTMQTFSVRRKEVDWPSFRKLTLEHAGPAQTPEDTYPDIRSALNRLDNHSWFREPKQTLGQAAEGQKTPGTARFLAEAKSRTIRGERLGEEIGYVRVPQFGGSGEAAVDFATTLKNTIARVDTATVCGWIVDLRENTGGNMWPMVAGIGPVVGEGHLGSFVTPDSVTTRWFYENGASRAEENVIVRVSGTPYELHHPVPPTAVLIGPRTASSGEAVAVAFQGRDRTRSFGHPTAGLSTAISPFQLSDGAVMGLAVATFADRTGTLYGDEILPDVNAERSPRGETDPNDPIVDTAEEWVANQSACARRN